MHAFSQQSAVGPMEATAKVWWCFAPYLACNSLSSLPDSGSKLPGQPNDLPDARVVQALHCKFEYRCFCEEEVFSVKVVPAKTLSKDAQPVEFYLVDEISMTLFGHWWNYFSPEQDAGNADKVFMFPLVLADGSFDWKQPFSYANHRGACQLAAEVLGLQASPEFLSNLGSNAVRRGNAARLGQEIRGQSQQAICTIALCTASDTLFWSSTGMSKLEWCTSHFLLECSQNFLLKAISLFGATSPRCEKYSHDDIVPDDVFWKQFAFDLVGWDQQESMYFPNAPQMQIFKFPRRNTYLCSRNIWKH